MTLPLTISPKWLARLRIIGITLAVATLIIVMSVMNGFRAELLSRILGFQGHVFVTGGVLDGPERDLAAARILKDGTAASGINRQVSRAKLSDHLTGSPGFNFSPTAFQSSPVWWPAPMPSDSR